MSLIDKLSPKPPPEECFDPRAYVQPDNTSPTRRWVSRCDNCTLMTEYTEEQDAHTRSGKHNRHADKDPGYAAT